MLFISVSLCTKLIKANTTYAPMQIIFKRLKLHSKRSKKASIHITVLTVSVYELVNQTTLILWRDRHHCKLVQRNNGMVKTVYLWPSLLITMIGISLSGDFRTFRFFGILVLSSLWASFAIFLYVYPIFIPTRRFNNVRTRRKSYWHVGKRKEPKPE